MHEHSGISVFPVWILKNSNLVSYLSHFQTGSVKHLEIVCRKTIRCLQTTFPCCDSRCSEGL